MDCDHTVRLHNALILVGLICSVLLCSSGCAVVGLASVVMYAWKGQMVPARYEGLEGKRVAVVCLSDTNMYAGELAIAIEKLLQRNVPEIDVIPQTDIYAWQDTNDWDGFELDFATLGKGVDADLVVAIEIDSFRLYDGQTMYKGRAKLSTTVYDVFQGEEPVFSRLPIEHVFPVNAAYATTDMNEDKFRRLFLISVAREVAKNFYSYDVQDDFAADPTLVAR